jgi:hypothetical protein
VVPQQAVEAHRLADGLLADPMLRDDCLGSMRA